MRVKLALAGANGFLRRSRLILMPIEPHPALTKNGVPPGADLTLMGSVLLRMPLSLTPAPLTLHRFALYRGAFRKPGAAL
jgi:hypothetical protein